jgi:hypothetical protein
MNNSFGRDNAPPAFAEARRRSLAGRTKLLTSLPRMRPEFVRPNSEYFGSRKKEDSVAPHFTMRLLHLQNNFEVSPWFILLQALALVSSLKRDRSCKSPITRVCKLTLSSGHRQLSLL